MHQPGEREQTADAAPHRRANPLPVHDADDDGRPDHRGIKEPLLQREPAADVRARRVGGPHEGRVEQRTTRRPHPGGGQRSFDDQHRPGGDPGKQPDDHGHEMTRGRHLERLRGDDDADPQE